MLNYLGNLQKERFALIREQLAKVYSGVEIHEAVRTYSLSNDPHLRELAFTKFKEVTEGTLAAEREVYIERLAHEITTLNEKLTMQQKESKDQLVQIQKDEEEIKAKRKYKAMVKSMKLNEDALNVEIQHLKDQLKSKDSQISQVEKEYSEYKTSMKSKEEKMGELQRQIESLRKELQEYTTSPEHRRQSSGLSELAAIGEKTGINITALPMTELEQMRTKISNLKLELGETKSKERQAEEENIMLRMQCDSMAKEIERWKDEFEAQKQLTRIEIEKKGACYSDKLKKEKERHQKKLTKLSQQFQSILEQKVDEIQTTADIKVSKAQKLEKENKKTYDEKTQQLQEQYLTFKDSNHQAIIDQIKKTHQVEVSSLTKKYEAELNHVKNDLHHELDELKEQNSSTVEECAKQLDSLQKQLKDNDKKSKQIVKRLEEELELTRSKMKLADNDVQRLKVELGHAKQAYESMLPKFDKAQVKKAELKKEFAASLQKVQDLGEELSKSNAQLGGLKERIVSLT